MFQVENIRFKNFFRKETVLQGSKQNKKNLIASSMYKLEERIKRIRTNRSFLKQQLLETSKQREWLKEKDK